MRDPLTSRWKRMGLITLFGFSSGLPLALSVATLQAWLKSEHVDIGRIGLFALAGLPYSLKFTWSPLMDRYALPWLGRRRGWILAMQLALAGAIALLAMLDPKTSLGAMAAAACLVAILSASQDIVLDAYKAELLSAEERGLGVAMANIGYRAALILAGAVALVLSDHMPWRSVYLIMAASMSIGMIATLMAPEPSAPARASVSLLDSVVLPFREFFGRPGALEVVAFAVLYKLDAVVATALTTPFLMDLGFSKSEIGSVAKTAGIAASIVGSLAGGALMVRWDLRKALWTFGWLQGLAGLSFMLLALTGYHYPLMVASNFLENFCSGLGSTAYVAFLMSLCDRRYTATQFAFLTSLMALTRTLGAAPTGYLVHATGWPVYFGISVLIGLPSLLMLYRYDRWVSFRATTA